MMSPSLIPFTLEKYDIGYYYDGINFIVDRPLSNEEEIKTLTVKSILLAKAFTATFPQLLTPELGGFFELFPAPIDSISQAAYAAIDLYEVYYSLRISKSYSGGDVTEDELHAEIERILSVIEQIQENNSTAIETNTEEPQINIIPRNKTMNNRRKKRWAPYSKYTYPPRFSYKRPEKNRAHALKTLDRLTKGTRNLRNIMRVIRYRKTRKHRHRK
jgi:hypothetical protein